MGFDRGLRWDRDILSLALFSGLLLFVPTLIQAGWFWQNPLP
jgi:hypothetical protein